MKKFLRRIWEDIKQGENIDNYVYVFVALLLALLAIIDVVPDEWMAPITLGILSILAFANIGNRHKLDEINRKLSSGATGSLLTKYPDDGDIRMIAATEIWFVGISLYRTIDEHYALLEDKLSSGKVRLNILLRDPMGDTYKLVSRHDYNPTTPEQVQSKIRLTLSRLCRLKEMAPKNIEIRTIDNQLPFNLFGFDINDLSGSIYIEYHPYKVPVESLPKIIVTPETAYWYEFYKKQLETVWENGKDWPCSSK